MKNMVRNPNKKPLYFTILIDLKGSRTNFKSQAATSEFIAYFLQQLNGTFISRLGDARFNQKDGDAIMIVLQEGMEEQVFKIYQFCNSLIYRPKFKEFYSTKLLPNKSLKFYFSIGVGSVDTNLEQLNNVDVVNGTSVSRATEGVAIAKMICQNELPDSFNFKKSPFKLFINTTTSLGIQMNADSVMGLFYLLYEKILNTQAKRLGYALLYPERKMSNIDLARELATEYKKPAYDVNYEDATQRAQVSSKVSVMLSPVKKEPIETIQNAIVNGLVNVRKELS